MKQLREQLREERRKMLFDSERRRERQRRQRQRVVACCKQLAAFLFSHVGLAGMVVAYSIMGGFLFRALEAPFERRVKLKVVSDRGRMVDDIWRLASNLAESRGTLRQPRRHDTRYQGVPRAPAGATVTLAAQRHNFTTRVEDILRSFQYEVRAAVKDQGWDGNDDTDEAQLQWSFAGALLYAVTVTTTIGYGHVAPKTSWGRLLTIVYALVGIPLTFLYLSNIGNFLADCFRLFYKRVCCDVLCCEKCERKRKRLRLKLRRRREIMAAAAQQSNFRFSEWNGGETPAAIVSVEPARNPRFVEIPQAAAGIITPLGPRQSSSSWTTVSTTSAAAEGEDSPGKESTAAVLGEVSGARETDILEDETTATSDDERTTTDDALMTAVRETDIIDVDDDDVQRHHHLHYLAAGSPDHSRRLADAGDATCRDAKTERQPSRRRGTRISRSHSDTRLDSAVGQTLTSATAANDSSRRVRMALGAAGAGDRDVMRRSASVKARPTGAAVSRPESMAATSQTELLEGAGRRNAVGDVDKTAQLRWLRLRELLRKRSSAESRDASPAVGPCMYGEGPGVGQDWIAVRPPKHRRDGGGRSRGDDAPPPTARLSDGRRRALPSKSMQTSVDSFVTAPSHDEYHTIDDDVHDYRSPVTIRHLGDRGDAVTLIADSMSHRRHDGGGVPVAFPNELPLIDLRLTPAAISADNAAGTDFDFDPFDYELETGDSEDDLDTKKVTVPITICLVIIAGYIFAGAVLFTLWEDWDYLTGSYFCFITLSTIGFGDIVPGTDMDKWASSEKLVLCALWLAFGLSLLAMCFNLMQEEVKEKCKWLGKKLGLLKNTEDDR